MTRPRITIEALRDCQQRGMTAPEAAEYLGCGKSYIYRVAQRHGITFANRKVNPPPNTVAREASAAALRALSKRHQATPVNGWTWAQLAEAGFTAPEAARLRGVNKEAAYAAERKYGVSFRRHFTCPRRNPAAGLTPDERIDYDNYKSKLHATREEALLLIGRGDLLSGMQVGNPIEDMARRMKANAARCNAAMKQKMKEDAT